jgi:protein subunit release factor B
MNIYKYILTKTFKTTVMDIKTELIRKIKRIPIPSPYGGQSVGISPSKVILESEELNLRIEIGYHRSQLRNHQDAMLLMELYIDEIIGKLNKTNGITNNL